MAPCFSKNAILMGAVDHFCLVCEAHLKCDDDVLVHIKKPIHNKSLETIENVQLYEKDHIKKIKNKYFCEFCNILMSTLANVRVHVEEPSHIQNKANPSPTRVGNTVVFKGIMITHQAWNGLLENSCVICNIEYEDENIHKTQATHILNLVQKNVEYDKDNIYRKIDECMVQCLTCNMVMTLDSITSHWDSTDHKDKYLLRVINNINNKDSFMKVGNPKSTNPDVEFGTDLKDKVNENKNKILNSLSRLEENGMLINFKTNIALCKKCDSSLNFDFETIKEHIKNHEEQEAKNVATVSQSNVHEKGKKHTIKKAEHQCISNKVGKEVEKSLCTSPVMLKPNDKSKASKDKIEFLTGANNMEINSNDNNISCKACNTKITYSLKSLKKHIATDNHKAKMQEQNKIMTKSKRQLSKIIFEKFCRTLICIDNIFDSQHVIINYKICINIVSFMCISNMRNYTLRRCEICDEYIHAPKVKLHCNTSKHTEALENCMFITEFDSEFIREVQSGKYHCGFCNIVVQSWEDMELHLKCLEHTKNKILSIQLLQRYEHEIRHHQMSRFYRQLFNI